MPQPDISAIICTHNRDAYLGDAIDSLLQQDFTNFEILVVDNGSSDRTKEVVAQRQSDPRVKYIYEPTLGLNVARNTGVRETTSAIVAYLDDDAIATPTWLSVIHRAFQSNPQIGVAGGKIDLIWPAGVTPPPWLSPGLAENLGAYDLGDEVLYIDRPGLTPRGLNYAIRRTVYEEVGGFDIKLDRAGKNLLSNGDLYMTELVLNKGWQVAYLPEAIVAHQVFAERVQRSWFLNRGWWQGISECYRERLTGRAGIGQLGNGGEKLVRGLYKSLKYFRDPALSFDNLVYAYGQIGYLSTALRGMLFGSPLAGSTSTPVGKTQKSDRTETG
ncbi:glycosyltransferase family 2 protein [Laspinema sp. A4]|uniref:glycosyltransferase n=1 Tax=Laspinema sp. D2d TaxID=2953686 RepID=UPI0021BB742A|nr:glycosyltransferase family 2 protein [Laspinema sp. D2d]MCT7986123.1 glycosyltransferase family 2 protein [Laspinema sp. D2d]